MSFNDLPNRGIVANDNKSTDSYNITEPILDEFILHFSCSTENSASGRLPQLSSERRDASSCIQSGSNATTIQTSGANNQLSNLCEISEELSQIPSEIDVEEALKVPSKEQECKNVRFGRVQVRTYPIILGDNPGGVSGPPLSIDWETTSTKSYSIEKVEKVRRRHRRGSDDLRRSPYSRYKVLKALNVSDHAINLAELKAEQTRHQRQATCFLLDHSELHERMEKWRRNVRNVLSLGCLKRREKRFLRRCVPSLRQPSSRQGIEQRTLQIIESH